MTDIHSHGAPGRASKAVSPVPASIPSADDMGFEAERLGQRYCQIQDQQYCCCEIVCTFPHDGNCHCFNKALAEHVAERIDALRYRDGLDERHAIVAGKAIGVDAVLAIDCVEAWLDSKLGAELPREPYPQDPLSASQMETALDELHGCMIRRPESCCEVRKEFLAVALETLASAIEARRAETLGSVEDESATEQSEGTPNV